MPSFASWQLVRVWVCCSVFSCLEAYSQFSSWNPQVSCINIERRKHYPPTGYNLCVDPCNPLRYPLRHSHIRYGTYGRQSHFFVFPTESSSGRLLPDWDQKRRARYWLCNFLSTLLPNSTFWKSIPAGIKWNSLRWLQHAKSRIYFILQLREATVFLRFPCERWITPPLMNANFVRRSIVSLLFIYLFFVLLSGCQCQGK